MPIYADAHADIFYEVTVNHADLISGENTVHVTLDAMRASEQVLQVCSLWTPLRMAGDEAERFCFSMLDALDACVREHPQDFALIRHAHELRRLQARSDSRVGLIPWMEGASPLRGDMEVFRQFVARGLKGIGLVWNHGNEVTDGCGVESPRRGLTEFGRELIAEMNRARVIIDLAHCPEPAFSEVLATSTRPVVVTHTGMRALVDIERNVSDHMARAIAERGGFIGIDYYPAHVDPHAFKPCARQTSLDQLIANIRHAVNVCGIDAVVLGSDFDGFRDTIAGLEHLNDMPNLWEAMRNAGFTEREIEKIAGLNLIDKLVEMW